MSRPLSATYANVRGHASQRDTCHELATYVLLRRWEASPPTNATDVLLRAKMLFRPYDGANVGGHASQRDTCHELATYALLRRWEASPPTNATDALLRAEVLLRPYMVLM